MDDIFDWVTGMDFPPGGLASIADFNAGESSDEKSPTLNRGPTYGDASTTNLLCSESQAGSEGLLMENDIFQPFQDPNVLMQFVPSPAALTQELHLNQVAPSTHEHCAIIHRRSISEPPGDVGMGAISSNLSTSTTPMTFHRGGQYLGDPQQTGPSRKVMQNKQLFRQHPYKSRARQCSVKHVQHLTQTQPGHIIPTSTPSSFIAQALSSSIELGLPDLRSPPTKSQADLSQRLSLAAQTSLTSTRTGDHSHGSQKPLLHMTRDDFKQMLGDLIREFVQAREQWGEFSSNESRNISNDTERTSECDGTNKSW